MTYNGSGATAPVKVKTRLEAAVPLELRSRLERLCREVSAAAGKPIPLGDVVRALLEQALDRVEAERPAR